jgi:hypothetical protein
MTMTRPGLLDDPIERARVGPADPQPIVLRTRRAFFAPRATVTLRPAGLAWTVGRPKSQGEVPWSLVGGVALNELGRGGPWAQIRGVDGSLLATIVGMFERGGPVAMLPHIVALYRPDLFVELDGNWLNPGGCVRRDATRTEASAHE